MGLHSTSSSSDHWRSSLSSEEEEDVACTTPLGDNGSMGRGREHCARMGFFVGCKSWERKRALCENRVFCWLQEWGAEEGAGRKGIFMAKGTHSAIIEKTTPENIRVVVGSVQFKLIKFCQIYTYIYLSGSENSIVLWMEGGRSEEGGKTVQRNVNGPKEIIVVQKVLLAIHQYTGPSGLPFPLICLCWSCNSSIVLPQTCSLAILELHSFR
jgi:hypothetical protein